MTAKLNEKSLALLRSEVETNNEFGSKAIGAALGALLDWHDKHFDLQVHLERQKAFSEKTFGPGRRTQGVIDHIRKELAEIEADPTDIMEWVDVIILAFDGAWRAGWKPHDIIDAIVLKQSRNENRQWPDWRSSAPDKAIEHIRTEGQP